MSGLPSSRTPYDAVVAGPSIMTGSAADATAAGIRRCAEMPTTSFWDLVEAAATGAQADTLR
jgi:hypothetical protein